MKEMEQTFGFLIWQYKLQAALLWREVWWQYKPPGGILTLFF